MAFSKTILAIRPRDRIIARHILRHDLPQRSMAENYRRNIKVPIRISGEIRKIVIEGYDGMARRIGCGRGLDLELVLKIVELKLGPRLTDKLLIKLLEQRSRRLKRRKFKLRCSSGKAQVFEVRKRRT